MRDLYTKYADSVNRIALSMGVRDRSSIEYSAIVADLARQMILEGLNLQDLWGMPRNIGNMESLRDALAADPNLFRFLTGRISVNAPDPNGAIQRWLNQQAAKIGQGMDKGFLDYNSYLMAMKAWMHIWDDVCEQIGRRPNIDLTSGFGYELRNGQLYLKYYSGDYPRIKIGSNNQDLADITVTLMKGNEASADEYATWQVMQQVISGERRIYKIADAGPGYENARRGYRGDIKVIEKVYAYKEQIPGYLSRKPLWTETNTYDVRTGAPIRVETPHSIIEYSREYHDWYEVPRDERNPGFGFIRSTMPMGGVIRGKDGNLKAKFVIKDIDKERGTFVMQVDLYAQQDSQDIIIAKRSETCDIGTGGVLDQKNSDGTYISYTYRNMLLRIASKAEVFAGTDDVPISVHELYDLEGLPGEGIVITDIDPWDNTKTHDPQGLLLRQTDTTVAGKTTTYVYRNKDTQKEIVRVERDEKGRIVKIGIFKGYVRDKETGDLLARVETIDPVRAGWTKSGLDIETFIRDIVAADGDIEFKDLDSELDESLIETRLYNGSKLVELTAEFQAGKTITRVYYDKRTGNEAFRVTRNSSGEIIDIGMYRGYEYEDKISGEIFTIAELQDKGYDEKLINSEYYRLAKVDRLDVQKAGWDEVIDTASGRMPASEAFLSQLKNTSDPVKAEFRINDDEGRVIRRIPENVKPFVVETRWYSNEKLRKQIATTEAGTTVTTIYYNQQTNQEVGRIVTNRDGTLIVDIGVFEGYDDNHNAIVQMIDPVKASMRMRDTEELAGRLRQGHNLSIKRDNGRIHIDRFAFDQKVIMERRYSGQYLVQQETESVAGKSRIEVYYDKNRIRELGRVERNIMGDLVGIGRFIGYNERGDAYVVMLDLRKLVSLSELGRNLVHMLEEGNELPVNFGIPEDAMFLKNLIVTEVYSGERLKHSTISGITTSVFYNKDTVQEIARIGRTRVPAYKIDDRGMVTGKERVEIEFEGRITGIGIFKGYDKEGTGISTVEMVDTRRAGLSYSTGPNKSMPVDNRIQDIITKLINGKCIDLHDEKYGIPTRAIITREYSAEDLYSETAFSEAGRVKTMVNYKQNAKGEGLLAEKERKAYGIDDTGVIKKNMLRQIGRLEGYREDTGFAIIKMTDVIDATDETYVAGKQWTEIHNVVGIVKENIYTDSEGITDHAVYNYDEDWLATTSETEVIAADKTVVGTSYRGEFKGYFDGYALVQLQNAQNGHTWQELLNQIAELKAKTQGVMINGDFVATTMDIFNYHGQLGLLGKATNIYGYEYKEDLSFIENVMRQDMENVVTESYALNRYGIKKPATELTRADLIGGKPLMFYHNRLNDYACEILNNKEGQIRAKIEGLVINGEFIRLSVEVPRYTGLLKHFSHAPESRTYRYFQRPDIASDLQAMEGLWHLYEDVNDPASLKDLMQKGLLNYGRMLNRDGRAIPVKELGLDDLISIKNDMVDLRNAPLYQTNTPLLKHAVQKVMDGKGRVAVKYTMEKQADGTFKRIKVTFLEYYDGRKDPHIPTNSPKFGLLSSIADHSKTNAVNYDDGSINYNRGIDESFFMGIYDNQVRMRLHGFESKLTSLEDRNGWGRLSDKHEGELAEGEKWSRYAKIMPTRHIIAHYDDLTEDGLGVLRVMDMGQTLVIAGTNKDGTYVYDGNYPFKVSWFKEIKEAGDIKNYILNLKMLESYYKDVDSNGLARKFFITYTDMSDIFKPFRDALSGKITHSSMDRNWNIIRENISNTEFDFPPTVMEKLIYLYGEDEDGDDYYGVSSMPDEVKGFYLGLTYENGRLYEKKGSITLFDESELYSAPKLGIKKVDEDGNVTYFRKNIISDLSHIFIKNNKGLPIGIWGIYINPITGDIVKQKYITLEYGRRTDIPNHVKTASLFDRSNIFTSSESYLQALLLDGTVIAEESLYRRAGLGIKQFEERTNAYRTRGSRRIIEDKRTKSTTNFDRWGLEKDSRTLDKGYYPTLAESDDKIGIDRNSPSNSIKEKTGTIRERGVMFNPYFPDRKPEYYEIGDMQYFDASGNILFEGEEWCDKYGNVVVRVVNKSGGTIANYFLNREGYKEYVKETVLDKDKARNIKLDFSGGTEGGIDVSGSEYIYMYVDAKPPLTGDVEYSFVVRDKDTETVIGHRSLLRPYAGNNVREPSIEKPVRESTVVVNSEWKDDEFALVVPVKELVKQGIDISDIRDIELQCKSKVNGSIRTSPVYRLGDANGLNRLELEASKLEKENLPQVTVRSTGAHAVENPKIWIEGKTYYTVTNIYDSANKHLRDEITIDYIDELTGRSEAKNIIIYYDEYGRYPVLSVDKRTGDKPHAYAVKEKDGYMYICTTNTITNIESESALSKKALNTKKPAWEHHGEFVMIAKMERGALEYDYNKAYNTLTQYIVRSIKGEDVEHYSASLAPLMTTEYLTGLLGYIGETFVKELTRDISIDVPDYDDFMFATGVSGEKILSIIQDFTKVFQPVIQYQARAPDKKTPTLFLDAKHSDIASLYDNSILIPALYMLGQQQQVREIIAFALSSPKEIETGLIYDQFYARTSHPRLGSDRDVTLHSNASFIISSLNYYLETGDSEFLSRTIDLADTLIAGQLLDQESGLYFESTATQNIITPEHYYREIKTDDQILMLNLCEALLSESIKKNIGDKRAAKLRQVRDNIISALKDKKLVDSKNSIIYKGLWKISEKKEGAQDILLGYGFIPGLSSKSFLTVMSFDGAEDEFDLDLRDVFDRFESHFIISLGKPYKDIIAGPNLAGVDQGDVVYTEELMNLINLLRVKTDSSKDPKDKDFYKNRLEFYSKSLRHIVDASKNSSLMDIPLVVSMQKGKISDASKKNVIHRHRATHFNDRYRSSIATSAERFYSSIGFSPDKAEGGKFFRKLKEAVDRQALMRKTEAREISEKNLGKYIIAFVLIAATLVSLGVLGSFYKTKPYKPKKDSPGDDDKGSSEGGAPPEKEPLKKATLAETLEEKPGSKTSSSGRSIVKTARQSLDNIKKSSLTRKLIVSAVIITASLLLYNPVLGAGIGILTQQSALALSSLPLVSSVLNWFGSLSAVKLTYIAISLGFPILILTTNYITSFARKVWFNAKMRHIAKKNKARLYVRSDMTTALTRWNNMINMTSDVSSHPRVRKANGPIEVNFLFSLRVIYTLVVKQHKNGKGLSDDDIITNTDDPLLNGLDAFVLMVGMYMRKVIYDSKRDEGGNLIDSNHIWSRFELYFYEKRELLRDAMAQGDTDEFKNILKDIGIVEIAQKAETDEKILDIIKGYEDASSVEFKKELAKRIGVVDQAINIEKFVKNFKDFIAKEDLAKPIHPWALLGARMLPRFLLAAIGALIFKAEALGVTGFLGAFIAGPLVSAWPLLAILGAVVVSASLISLFFNRYVDRDNRLSGISGLISRLTKIGVLIGLICFITAIPLTSLAIAGAPLNIMWIAKVIMITYLALETLGQIFFRHSITWLSLRYHFSPAVSTGGPGAVISYITLYALTIAFGTLMGFSTYNFFVQFQGADTIGSFLQLIGGVLVFINTLYLTNFGFWQLLTGIASGVVKFPFQSAALVFAISAYFFGLPLFLPIIPIALLLAKKVADWAGWFNKSLKDEPDEQEKKTVLVYMGGDALGMFIRLKDPVGEFINRWVALRRENSEVLSVIRKELGWRNLTPEKEIESLRKCLKALNTAEQKDKISLFHLRQLEKESDMPGILKIDPGTDKNKKLIIDGWRIRRHLVEMLGKAGHAQDTGINLAEQAEKIGQDKGLKDKILFYLMSNKYNMDKGGEPYDLDTVGLADGNDLGQRELLALLIEYFLGNTKQDTELTDPPMSAYVLYDWTPFGFKSAAMNAIDMVPEHSSDIGSMVVMDRDATVHDLDSFIYDLKRVRRNENIAIIVPGRGTTNTLTTIGKASQLIEEGHRSYLTGVMGLLGGTQGEFVGTGWGNMLRVTMAETLEALGISDYPTPSTTKALRKSRKQKGFLDKLFSNKFGIKGYVANAVGISEDIWAVIQAGETQIGLGRIPKMHVSKAFWHKIRETFTHAEWFTAFPRWSGGLMQMNYDIIMQRATFFGPFSVFAKEVRQLGGDFFTSSPFALLNILIMPLAVWGGFSPFYGILLGFWLAGFIFTNILMLHGLVAYLEGSGFNMITASILGLAIGTLTSWSIPFVAIGFVIGGFIVGLSKWLISRPRDMILFPLQLVVHAYAQIKNASLVPVIVAKKLEKIAGRINNTAKKWVKDFSERMSLAFGLSGAALPTSGIVDMPAIKSDTAKNFISLRSIALLGSGFVLISMAAIYALDLQNVIMLLAGLIFSVGILEGPNYTNLKEGGYWIQNEHIRRIAVFMLNIMPKVFGATIAVTTLVCLHFARVMLLTNPLGAAIFFSSAVITASLVYLLWRTTDHYKVKKLHKAILRKHEDKQGILGRIHTGYGSDVKATNMGKLHENDYRDMLYSIVTSDGYENPETFISQVEKMELETLEKLGIDSLMKREIKTRFVSELIRSYRLNVLLFVWLFIPSLPANINYFVYAGGERVIKTALEFFRPFALPLLIMFCYIAVGQIIGAIQLRYWKSKIVKITEEDIDNLSTNDVIRQKAEALLSLLKIYLEQRSYGYVKNTVKDINKILKSSLFANSQKLFNYLAQRDTEDPAADLLLLFGNSRLECIDESARLYCNGKIQKILIAGGIGHETKRLRDNVKKAGYNVANIDIISEAEIMKALLVTKGVDEADIIVEIASTNTEENIRNALNILDKMDMPDSIILMQHPILQRRTTATYDKIVSEKENHKYAAIQRISYASYIPDASKLTDEELTYFKGEAVREIEKLEEYGPNGMGYIVKVKIPSYIQRAKKELVKDMDAMKTEQLKTKIHSETEEPGISVPTPEIPTTTGFTEKLPDPKLSSAGKTAAQEINELKTKVQQLQKEVTKNKFASLTEEKLLEEYLKEKDVKYELTFEDVAYLRGKTVMVIGAGGTIGTEIVRQLTDKETKQIIMIDNNENGIYDIRRELQERYDMVYPEVICLLGDVRNKRSVKSIFAKYQPNVIYHYANYKSLALGNVSPGEFVKVNIGGTRILLDIVSDCQSVERFIYISSDKAENPSQSYGRTKRINELLVQASAAKNPKIKFGSMRYCNVLDAAGSFAIPTFRDQIINNRPITVRLMENDEIPNRYFMPRHIAAKLAIKAGYECNKGDIFSLDKTQIAPIRIDELVKMIAEKSGIADVDPWFSRNVKFLKAEYGEKAAEELGKGEHIPGTPLIKIVTEEFPDGILLNEAIDRLLRLSDDINGDKKVEKALKDILLSIITGSDKELSEPRLSAAGQQIGASETLTIAAEGEIAGPSFTRTPSGGNILEAINTINNLQEVGVGRKGVDIGISAIETIMNNFADLSDTEFELARDALIGVLEDVNPDTYVLCGMAAYALRLFADRRVIEALKLVAEMPEPDYPAEEAPDSLPKPIRNMNLVQIADYSLQHILATDLLKVAPDVIAEESQAVIVYSDALMDSKALQEILSSVDKVNRRYYLVNKSNMSDKELLQKAGITEKIFDHVFKETNPKTIVNKIMPILAAIGIAQVRVFALENEDKNAWSRQNIVDVLLVILKSKEFEIMTPNERNNALYEEGIQHTILLQQA